MNPATWIALASLSGFILAQTAGFAFALGGMFSRLKALEARPVDTDCKTELAVLTTKFEGMEKTLKDVSHDLKNLLTGRLVPAGRQKASEGA
jgi:hypothetical protein